MGRDARVRARHPGAARRLWTLLLTRPLGDAFMSRDIVAQYPEFNVGRYPEKGVGRAIGHLIRMGGVEVAERARLPGETWITCVYRRCADDLLSAPKPRPPAPVKPANLREIRFPDTWKPFRDGAPKARWLGYSSSLAGIE